VGFPIDTELETLEFRSLGELGELGESGGSGHIVGSGGSDGSGGSGALGVGAVRVVTPVQLGIGRWSRWIAVAGGFGYVPRAPGTAGSIAGVLLFLLAVSAGIGLSSAAFLMLYGLGVAALGLIGIRAAGRAEVDFGRRDDGRIVIDEVVGQLVALAPLAVVLATSMPRMPRTPLSPSALLARDDLFLVFIEVVTGFVLFRLFDVWKPGAVRWAERRFEGGLGVMADDVMAGFHAALVLFVLHILVFERFFSAAVSSSASISFMSVISLGISA
jgi:phosphatidylglycerophosphatase A